MSHETFDVTLSKATGGASRLGAPATRVVTIQDDDEPVSVVEVPTVGEWGLAILTALVAAAAAARLRRRRGRGAARRHHPRWRARLARAPRGRRPRRPRGRRRAIPPRRAEIHGR